VTDATSGAPVAAIDVGTNSVLLLVAERRAGAVVAVEERAEITRLGKDVDDEGDLRPDAIERTVSVLRDYAARAKELRATRIVAVATSAARDAGNGEDFLSAATEALGTRPDIVSGRREADLTFRGALMGLEPQGPVAVFDVGGGSTELIVRVGPLIDAASLNIGAVRLTERFIRHDPPLPEELSALRAFVATALGGGPSLRDRPLVGVAGTVTTLAAISHELEPYRPGALHGTILASNTVTELVARLASLPVEARRAVPGLAPKRADVIVAGAIIVEQVCAHGRAERLLVSERGVRWGLAAELLDEGPQEP